VKEAGWIRQIRRKKCHYCRSRGGTLDHVVPKSLGGKTCRTNLVGSCWSCNAEKADSLPSPEHLNVCAFCREAVKDVRMPLAGHLSQALLDPDLALVILARLGA
jgi:hypothetical protein